LIQSPLRACWFFWRAYSTGSVALPTAVPTDAPFIQKYLNTAWSKLVRGTDRPDFIVTDLQMPGMSGLELCTRLAAEIQGGIPTILLTAKGFEISPEAVAHLPIRRVMSKPFSPRELLAAVQESLGGPVN
jgi:CheY-like chemotaxis protein